MSERAGKARAGMNERKEIARQGFGKEGDVRNIAWKDNGTRKDKERDGTGRT